DTPPSHIRWCSELTHAPGARPPPRGRGGAGRAPAASRGVRGGGGSGGARESPAGGKGAALLSRVCRRFPFISESLARHYARTYGSNSEWILKEASALSDLGEDFGHEFYEAELKYLVEHEWVRSLDDAIWRRTKQGMWLTAEQQARISEWLAQHAGKSELSLAS
ncbi:hypothetical protein I8Q49_22270, partial [Acinetobacter baumannii]|nr:hypothetical protein [Acinetobacter baumannii]